jgi:hypothetical protein
MPKTAQKTGPPRHPAGLAAFCVIPRDRFVESPKPDAYINKKTTPPPPKTTFLSPRGVKRVLGDISLMSLGPVGRFFLEIQKSVSQSHGASHADFVLCAPVLT